MSDEPELTALQLWILRAQREILLKGNVGRDEPASRRRFPPTGDESTVRAGK
jgi:hypothetical protein